MVPIFLVDTIGNANLLGEQQNSLVYKRENFIINHKKIEGSDVLENSKIELFGLELDSKDIEKAVNDNHLCKGKQLNTKVKRNFSKEKVANASGNSSPKPVSHLSYSNAEANMKHQNVVNNMKRAKRAVEPGFDQRKSLSTMSRRKQPAFNRVIRTKSKGSGWFDLPATEVTEEMRNELKIIQMRSVLNPKQFYKKNDLKNLPKYFQIGTVQHSVIDHHKEKNTRKSHKTLVDELLENEAFQNFNRRKYKEVNERINTFSNKKGLKKRKNLKNK
ncbi:deoxynucleotidyltransferase terminal-interacting protein 2 [Drosophila bipectinata]|uniref:deoxynucleotidyltransferase terminal-interacting protein 2 n=1 Tax=Drosophila bipectinata TaxID=42026 RepID=UPI001C8AC13E|nr:deoxynucleotidyltransferase terminal-interacting protein 2 [Drosophila bipectinata]